MLLDLAEWRLSFLVGRSYCLAPPIWFCNKLVSRFPLFLCSSSVQVLDTRNCLQWMQDLEDTLHVKALSQNLTKLAISQETIIQQLQEATNWEVERAITCRSNRTLKPGSVP